MVPVPLDLASETADPNGVPGLRNKSAVLHRDLAADLLPMDTGKGNYIVVEDGRKIFDASGGAAVGCLGWGNERVIEAISQQMRKMPYCATIFYTTNVQEELCQLLVDSTGGQMARAYIVNSGESTVLMMLTLFPP